MSSKCKNPDDAPTESSNASHEQSTTGSANLGEVHNNDARSGEVYVGQIIGIIRGENNFNYVPTSESDKASQGVDGTYTTTNNSNTVHEQSITSAANSDAHNGNVYNGDVYTQAGQANEIISGKYNFNYVVTSQSDKTSQGVHRLCSIGSRLGSSIGRLYARGWPPLLGVC